MKKLLSSILVLVLLLSGCGNTGNTNENSILVWVQTAEGTDEGNAYQDAVDRYNSENPDLTPAKIEYIPRDSSGGGYEDKINAAISSGDLPDIIAVDGPNLSSYVSSNIVVPITDYISEEKISDYTSSLIEGTTINNELYALGGFDTSVITFYNEDYVDSNLMSDDVNNPNTWKDILDVCDSLEKEQADNPDWVCIDYNFSSDEWAPYSLLPVFWSESVDIISEDGLTVDGYFNSKESAAVFEKIGTLVDKGYVSTTSTGDIQRFSQGNSAFRVDGAWNISYYDEFPELNWSTSYYPVTENWSNEPYVANGSWVFAVTANSLNPENAATLVNYLSDGKTGLKMYEGTQQIPTSLSTQEQISGNAGHDFNVAMNQLTNQSRPRPATPAYPILSKQFGLSVDQVVNTDSSPQDILDQNIQPIEADLEREKNE